MTKKEVLTVMDRLFKLSPEKVAEALELSDDMADTDAVDENKFLDFITAQQGKRVKERYDNGYQTAEKKIKSQLEKELKKEFNIESDLEGLELFKHIIEESTVDAGKGAGKSKLTDEDVKKHPLYLKLEADTKKQITDLGKEWENKLKSEQDSRSYEKLLAEIDDEAMKIFREMGEAILPEDKAIAEKHIKRLLLDEMKSGVKFQKTDNGYLILDEQGNRKEDKAGNALGYKDYVTGIAKTNFQFKAAQQRQSPNNTSSNQQSQQQQQQPKKYAGKAPTNSKEYIELLTSEEYDTEIKNDIKATYGVQFNN